jgi:hypothetical protein
MLTEPPSRHRIWKEYMKTYSQFDLYSRMDNTIIVIESRDGTTLWLYTAFKNVYEDQNEE